MADPVREEVRAQIPSNALLGIPDRPVQQQQPNFSWYAPVMAREEQAHPEMVAARQRVEAQVAAQEPAVVAEEARLQSNPVLMAASVFSAGLGPRGFEVVQSGLFPGQADVPAISIVAEENLRKYEESQGKFLPVAAAEQTFKDFTGGGPGTAIALAGGVGYAISAIGVPVVAAGGAMAGQAVANTPILAAGAASIGAATIGVGEFAAANSALISSATLVGTGMLFEAFPAYNALGAANAEIARNASPERVYATFGTQLIVGNVAAVAGVAGYKLGENSLLWGGSAKIPTGPKPLENVAYRGEDAKGIIFDETYGEVAPSKNILPGLYSLNAQGKAAPLLTLSESGRPIVGAPLSSDIPSVASMYRPQINPLTGAPVSKDAATAFSPDSPANRFLFENFVAKGAEGEGFVGAGIRSVGKGVDTQSAFKSENLPLKTKTAGEDAGIFNYYQQSKDTLFGFKTEDYGSYSAQAQLPAPGTNAALGLGTQQRLAGDQDVMILNRALVYSGGQVKGVAGGAKDFATEGAALMTRRSSEGYSYALQVTQSTGNAPAGVLVVNTAVENAPHTVDIHFAGQASALGSSAPEYAFGIPLNTNRFPPVSIEGQGVAPLGQQFAAKGVSVMGAYSNEAGQTVIAPLRYWKGAADAGDFLLAGRALEASQRFAGVDTTAFKADLGVIAGTNLPGVGRIGDLPAVQARMLSQGPGFSPAYAQPSPLIAPGAAFASPIASMATIPKAPAYTQSLNSPYTPARAGVPVSASFALPKSAPASVSVVLSPPSRSISVISAPSVPSSSVSAPSPSPSPSPSISQPSPSPSPSPSISPSSGSSFGGSGLPIPGLSGIAGFGGSRGAPVFKVARKARYTPSFSSALFGIRGKMPSSLGLASGIGLRPLLAKAFRGKKR